MSSNASYSYTASPYYNIDRDATRALLTAITYQPPAAEIAELERQEEARKAAKAARKAEKLWQKELKRSDKMAKKTACTPSKDTAAATKYGSDDSASMFSFDSYRSYGSRVNFLSRKSHDKTTKR